MMVLGPPQSIWQVATTLGFAKQICISGFLAKITGLHRSVVHRHLDHLGAGSSVQWKFPKNAGGRKRKAQDMPMDELPDVLPEFALPPHQLEPALFGGGQSASEPECPDHDDDDEQEDDAGNALFPGLDFGLTLGCLGLAWFCFCKYSQALAMLAVSLESEMLSFQMYVMCQCGKEHRFT